LSAHHLRARTLDGLHKSASYAQLALDRDPSYAPAHGALALARAVLASYGCSSPLVLMPQARASAERSLDLDPDGPEALCAMGLVKLFYDWDWAAAAQSLERALELRPKEPLIYCWLGIQRLIVKRHDDALRLAVGAATRDPLSPMIGALRGWFLCLLRRYEEAETVAKESIDLDPLFFRSYVTLAYTYLELDRIDLASMALERACVLTNNPVMEITLAECDARAGHRSAAMGRIARVCEGQGYVSAYWVARVCVWAGEVDRAFEFLTRAVRSREWFVILLGHDPAFDPIRRDVRFGCLLRSVGLEQAT